MKLFGEKKEKSCCNIKIEEVKTDDQESPCCHSEKIDENKEKAN